MLVHGEIWTIKEPFVYPNEFIYWSIQIVMYPFITGLIAGAFVLASLYHFFGIKELKDVSKFSLILSFALFVVAPMPLLLHLQHPLRGINVFLTPHFTSAIAAFGLVYAAYGAVVASEIWFLYRRYFVETARSLRDKPDKVFLEKVKYIIFSILTLGVYDVSAGALRKDEKAIKILAAVGVPTAFLLHGYAGFIFGSVKANALWMSPLMPFIFIMSAIVSGIALCMLTYVAVMEINKFLIKRERAASFPFRSEKEIRRVEVHEVRVTVKYLLMFMVVAITLEFFDLVFRAYTGVKSWEILSTVIYGKEFFNIFILQYGIGGVLPMFILLMPGLTVKRAVVGLILVLFGVFMMRWNVVIGGQVFSVTFDGYMHYKFPIVPHDYETFKEGLFGATLVGVLPFFFFWIFNKIAPVFRD
jgi:Ni/Fe-hydrogenase subunit HybB-like protein